MRRRSCGMVIAVAAAVLAMLGGTAARASTDIGYPLDWDGNDDGVCPVSVNSGGGVYLQEGDTALNSKTTDGSGYDYGLGESSAVLSYSQYNHFSSERDFDWRWSLVYQSTSDGTWHNATVTPWDSFALLPGFAQPVIPSYGYGIGPVAALYAVFEAKIHGTTGPPYPSAGAGYGYIETNTF